MPAALVTGGQLANDVAEKKCTVSGHQHSLASLTDRRRALDAQGPEPS
jgi:hypothetical protein